MSNHTAQNILVQRLKDIPIKVNEVYYHYRNHNDKYKIIAVALAEETEKPTIIYQALYGDNLVWTRSYDVWSQKVKIGEKEMDRFILDKI